jgi:hypothetical protein
MHPMMSVTMSVVMMAAHAAAEAGAQHAISTVNAAHTFRIIAPAPPRAPA